MDINDDYNPRRIQEHQESTLNQRHNDEDAENHLVGSHYHHARLEQNANNDWPMNGIKNSAMYVYPEKQLGQHQGYGDHDIDHRGGDGSSGSKYKDNMRGIGGYGKMSIGDGESFNDILNSNRQNVEGGSQLNKHMESMRMFDSGNKYGGGDIGPSSRMQTLPMLSEDLRISKIIRRLMVENNRKAALDLCKKLEAAVRNQANSTYICRSFDILFDNMLTVLRQCPLECLENASSILGVMGYINRYDFPIYKGHLTKAYGNFKNIRKYLMMAFKTTLRCDAVNLDLKTYSERLLGLLKEYLENAEVSENFISISETISEFSKNYKQSFQKHFTDIVDIIIGWHLEVEQPAELKRHCAKVLQQFAGYFLNELDFTFGLLGQFIEDIEACRDEIMAEDISAKSRQQTENRVGAFIGAFTSIIKALASKGVNLNEFGTASTILMNAKEVVNRVAKQCFQRVPLISEETVVNLNEFYCMILLYDKSVENLYDFEGIIELQLQHLVAFNDNQQSSFLFMILNIVRQYRTQLPLSFVSLVMRSDCEILQDLKLCCGSKPYKLLMKIYHEILIIKNVPLLQEAYRHILKDVNDTIKNLELSEFSSPAMMRNEMILNFYLASLAALACQTSSIIGMYALNPSILELLINNCQASNASLWSKYPTSHEALMELIIDHSTKNHNFRQSSRLLKPQHQDSPSSENFAMILKFFNNVLTWHVSENILKWLQQILEECQEDYETLTQKQDFLNICENIIEAALKQPIICCGILQTLLKYPKLPLYLQSNIKDIALFVTESSDKNLSSMYSEILALLPLEVTLTPNHDKQLFARNKEKIFSLFQWHKSSVCFNPLRPKYFKPFLESLDPNSSTSSSLYQSFVEKSSYNLPRDHCQEYLRNLQDNQQLLSYHLQYEAARYCVQQKLRTTLGKPQETFLGIEAIIMKYARFLAEKEGLPVQYKNLQNVMEIQQNCRMLLGFLENLEKHIYNAAEGCAYAMLPAEKPAKTFFRVNAPTCREWFKRIRTAVNLIALNCMEPEMVIRYSEIILQNEANLNNQALLDRTVTSLVWALYSCGESDTLYGLTTWLKVKQGKRYDWIQYVAEQANGHFEKAATGYLYTLHDENNKIIDPFMKEFIQKQFTQCFYHTARWSEIPSITQENIYSKQHLEIMESLYQTGGYQKQYNMENQELSKALVELTEWPEERETEQKNKKYTAKLETYSYYEILRKLQDTCIMETKSNESKEGLYESMRNCIQQGIKEGLMHSYEPGFNNNQLNELMIINHISHKLHEHEEISISSNDNNLDTKMSSLLLTKSLYWSLTTEQQPTKLQYNLLLNLSSRARSENNLNYCQSLLTRFFKMKLINLPLNEIAQQLKSKQLTINYNDSELVQGIEELVKCLQAQTTSISDALELGSACCSEIIQLQQTDQSFENSFYPSSISNLLLTMADWLTIHRLNNSNLTNGLHFQKLQNQLPDIPFCSHSDNSKCNLLPTSEYSVGKLLNASILCKQDSGEAWLSFGNWCYRWGKKLMEAKQTEQSAAAGTLTDVKDIQLTKRYINAIHEILKDKFNDDLIQQIIDLLNTHINNAINDENVEDLYSNSQNTTELLERELASVCSLNTDQLNAIIAIWRQAHKGVYGFYEESTRAYFKYLAIESESAAVAKRSNVDDEEVEDCTFVTTTLRLLRLIVKHAIGLQDVLEEGLRNTPLRPWKVIVPQLFSRLNHHEPYVRQSVSELLCRLAVNQPQLIIFPAVVGAQQELKHRNNTDTQVQLSSCFGTLLNSLAQQAPETVLQVQLLVKELRRITLLWEEYWIHGLAQLYAEYSPLYNALDAEAKKSNNSELMLAKYEVFRHHLLTDFNKIAANTHRDPETNYERTFQERFGPHIDVVSKALQKSLEVSKPSEYWQKIKQLYSIFQQRPLRGNSSTLRISDISPVLANMNNTSIAMPGIDTYEQPAVYIKSVDLTVFILPTKTKPKKLSLHGSNGQRYTYLFKGQEDLHLDERIMQFLSISNSMMAKSYGSKSKTDCFKAHHYSVIPLGSQSGLITWVDNCTPLFAIYKKWQQRDALLKQQQKERLSSSTKRQEQLQQSPVAANATRPSELFYNKLTPLLAESNLKVTDPRRQWPMPVLKRVLKELVTETPKDLLAKEIWCCSANAVEWRKSVRRYSMSMAVMSIIGYVIGLGDRHLDNVLIKLATGEIVHIDYNVCFEKGKTLRVPEKVPFRMTQNFKDALGLVGTEGAFRLACSHVLKILRKERETLLTLLEAFVYDPLVDWTISDDGTTTVSRGTSAHNAANIIASLDLNATTQNLSPKELLKNRKHEIDLSRQTLALRITEIKPAWLKYKNDFDLQLNDIDLHLETMSEYKNYILQLEQERDNLTKQQAMVSELEALGSARDSHALNTVNQRYGVFKRDLESFNKVKLMLQQTVKDLDLVLLTYFTIILNPEKINAIEVNPCDNAAINVLNESEFDLLKDLLVENNCNHLYTQAKYTRHEMENTFIQTQRSALECRDLLMVYSQVMKFQPRSQLQHNRLIKYKKTYSDLLDLPSTMENLEAIKVKRENLECCGQYFECLTMITMDLQKNIVQAKHILEEHKQQPIILSSVAINSINDFISLNPPYNNQILIISMLRHISQASQVFHLHEQTLLQNRDYFLLKQQINFLQLIDKFINFLYPSFKQFQNPEIFHLIKISLKSLSHLRDNMESLIEKIFSFYMMDGNLELQSCLQEFVFCMDYGILENCQQLNGILEVVNAGFGKFKVTLEALQQKILFVQEIRTNTGNESLLNSWNININNYLEKSRNDLLIKLFTSLEQSAVSIKTNDINNIYDIRKVRYPIDDLVLNIQSTLFDGLLSYAIEDINDNITNTLISLETVNELDLSNGDLLCGNLYVALQHESLLQSDESLVLHHSQLLKKHNIISTAFYWMNEQYLKDIPDAQNYVTTKREILNRLHNISQVLVVWKSTMLKIQADLELHRNSINDLLKNLAPSDELIIKKQQFEDIIAFANQRYSFFLNLSTRLSEYSAVLLQFEISSGDQVFEELVNRFENERLKLRQSKSSITDVERNLVQLLDPEDKIDQCWIENVSGLLDEMIYSVQKKIGDMEKEYQSIEKILLGDGQQMQILLDSSVRLDLRQLLKMLTKSYKQTTKTDTGESFQDLRDIQQSLKLLQTKLNELQTQLFSREFDAQSVLQIQQKVEELRLLCQKNNDGLNKLIERFLQMDAELESPQQRSDSPAISPTRSEQVNREVANSQMGEQKRNAYAVSVWKRIRMKLEGRDPDPNRRSSVTEQVDYVIREATNEENLASLYEGWTPWV